MDNDNQLPSLCDTWTSTYYRRPPHKATTNYATAVTHTLKKWQGLSLNTLCRHRMYYDPISTGVHSMTDNRKILTVDTTSCALCTIQGERSATNQRICNTCPFTTYLGLPCTSGPDSPWLHWVRTRDPAPMIRALLELQRVIYDDMRNLIRTIRTAGEVLTNSAVSRIRQKISSKNRDTVSLIMMRVYTCDNNDEFFEMPQDHLDMLEDIYSITPNRMKGKTP